MALDAGKKIVMGLVRIPPGVFRMGSGKGNDDEKPVHEVEITKEYWLGETEVTQGQWEAVMGRNPSQFKGSDRPVEGVSWEDCRRFIEALNRKVKDQTGGRMFGLPTEAEWEYACRAGSGTEWSWGDDEGRAGEYAWYEKNSGAQTHPVRQKKPNAWGLYDRHGNVGEWCEDRWGPYPAGRQVDPRGPEEGEYRVLRGGCWDYNPGLLRSANRLSNRPAERSDDVGLRVALR